MPAKKKKTTVRQHKGRLDDKVYGVILFLFVTLHWSLNKIATECNCHWDTVRRALSSVAPSLRAKPLPPAEESGVKKSRKLCQRRLASLAVIKEFKTGPAPEFNVYEQKKVPSCSALAHEYRERFGGSLIPKRTVLRHLNAVGLFSKARPKGPVRESTDPADRMVFCKKTLGKLKNKEIVIDKVLFSDEKWGNTNGHGLPMEFCRADEQPTRRIFNRYARSVHVWGAIGVGVKKLIILPKGSITAMSYVRDCLSKCRGILSGRWLMQDGARPHTANFTQTWLCLNEFEQLEGWPARSPDLNPIENLWAILARKVGNRLPVDEAELEKFFIEEWDAIPQKMIDDLVLSFVPRLKECVAQHGETISTAGCTRKHPVNRRL